MDRRFAIGAVIAVALLVAGLLWRGGSVRDLSTKIASRDQPSATSTAAGATAQPQQHAAASVAVATPTLASPTLANTAPTASRAATRASDAPRAAGLARSAVDEYRRRAQYPPWSMPLDDGSDDPIWRDHEVSRNLTRGAQGEDPALVCFPDQVSFEAPDPIVLYAYLSVGGRPVPAAVMEGEIRDPHSNLVTRLQFSDDGSRGDAEGGDHIYTAQFNPAAGLPLSGAYAVRVHAATADGGERFGTSGFLYSHPDAQLTGRYTDQLAGGNLQIGAEVRVSDTGRFHIQGTLYTQDGRPLGWAQNAAQLEPGVQMIRLTFFGRILRQKSVDGPYVLRFVALSTTTSMPNAKNRLVENAHVTQAYSADQFSDQPFNDPNLLDTADRLEGSVAPR